MKPLGGVSSCRVLASALGRICEPGAQGNRQDGGELARSYAQNLIICSGPDWPHTDREGATRQRPQDIQRFYAMRIAAYLRVSTGQQNHDSQRTELEGYCKRREWRDVQWFIDTASGTKQSREGLEHLMAAVRRGRVDVVLAFKLDRLARSLGHLAQLIAELQVHRVALVIPSQCIDTSAANPAAMFQFNVLAAVAQFERELIVERVRAGLGAARERGVKLGRPATSVARVEQVKTLMAHGLSAVEISRLASLPYSTTTQLVREIREMGVSSA